MALSYENERYTKDKENSRDVFKFRKNGGEREKERLQIKKTNKPTCGGGSIK